MGNIIFIVILALLVVAILVNFRKIGPFFKRLQAFFGEVSAEMKKVTWPTMDEVVNSTILVIVTVFALTIILWVVDFFIGGGMRWIFKAL